jgi:disulfide bond formation protein DsbB
MIDRWFRHAPRLLIWAGLLCLASLAAALVAQHAFDVRPCPWCILQRGIIMLLAACCLLGGAVAWWLKHHAHLHRAHLAARLTAIPVVLLAMGGLVAATYQHEVAAQSASCKMTVADQILTALELESRWPAVFMITADCQEAAAYRLLGLPYEIWSGLLFLLVLGVGLVALQRGARP